MYCYLRLRFVLSLSLYSRVGSDFRHSSFVDLPAVASALGRENMFQYMQHVSRNAGCPRIHQELLERYSSLLNCGLFTWRRDLAEELGS
jgi:hypothetical protein